jgi:hypothetical protein
MISYDYIKEINEASKNGKLTFFIGAGVSKLSKYPDWKELTNEFSKRLGMVTKDESSNYTNEEYLAIPQKYYYYIGKNEEEYYKLIKEQLDKDVEPNEVHDLILILKPASIITTNFDNLIEKSVSRQGLFYDVISSDLAVSEAKGSKFILKVHGDLETKNIVLKEEDYLNYSNNFKLIETLLKSIFSTNVIVFIGYTLGDYNIKLILNWVRNLQGEGFKTPYFIYTGNNALSDLDMMYYESRGLNIINYKDFSEEKLDWLERYKVVLTKIIGFEEHELRKKDSESIEYLYSMLSPLNELNVLRREDVGDKLKDDYIVDDDGTIRKYNPASDYLEKFNNLRSKILKGIEMSDVEKSIEPKYQVIKETFEKAHIHGYRDGHDLLSYKFDYSFKNKPYFSLDYQYMELFVNEKYDNLTENYMRAFYLFKLGQFKESYDTYTEIAQACFKEKDYLLYYFSQVNRYSVYKAIKYFERYSKSPAGMLTGYYGTEESLPEQTDLIMKNFDVDEIFESLPLEFKNKYSSLRNLYNSKSLYENIYKIVKATQKVESHIKSKSFESGFTSIDKVISILNPNLNFVYGNFMIIDEYDEFKTLVKESMKAILLTYSDKNSEYLAENELQIISQRNKEIQLDFLDFSCMIQYFKTDELKDIFREYNIKELNFISIEDCYEVAVNLIEYHKKNQNDFCNRYLYFKLKEHLNNLIQILKYMKLTKEQYQYIVSEIFEINNNTLNIGNKILFLDKQQAFNSNIEGQNYEVLEKILINYLNGKANCFKIGAQFNEDSINSLFHIDIVNYIVANNKDFKSNEINAIVVKTIDDNANINLLELIKLTPILYKDSVDKIITLAQGKLKVDFNFNILSEMLNYELIDNIEEYETKLIEYIRMNINNLNELEKDEKIQQIKFDDIKNNFDDISKIHDLKNNITNYLENISYWCFIGMVSKDKFIEFKGINNQFDFFVDMDSFDFNNFEQDWLVKFNMIEAHENIAKNKKTKIHIKNLIEEYLKNINFDINQKQWFIKLYLDVYNK